jgi:hypothetical protein
MLVSFWNNYFNFLLRVRFYILTAVINIYIYLTAIGLLPGGSVYKRTYIQQGNHTYISRHPTAQHSTNCDDYVFSAVTLCSMVKVYRCFGVNVLPEGQKISVRLRGFTFPVPYFELHLPRCSQEHYWSGPTCCKHCVVYECWLCCVANLFSRMTCWPHRDGVSVTFQLVWVMKDHTAPCHIPIGKWEILVVRSIPINQHVQINTRCAANVGNERQKPARPSCKAAAPYYCTA